MDIVKLLVPAAAGYLLDLLVGDPHWLYHPVRLIGKVISGLEKILRGGKPQSEAQQLRAGAKLCVGTLLCVGIAIALVLLLADRMGRVPSLIVRTLLCYWLLATRALKDESMKVYTALEANDLEGSRQAVSMIVGRDTQRLNEEGVAKAAVETVAENTSDGIIAPMLYMVLGGPLLGWLYKAVNTMDSMVGYKNEQYLYFGRAAARLDDVVNYIPARISALLMIAAAAVCGFSARQAWRVFVRDRYNHASPNSAQTESVMAGALGVQLAGDAWYFGKRYEKKTIGDPGRPVVAEDIVRANKLLYVTSFLGLICFLGLAALAGCIAA